MLQRVGERMPGAGVIESPTQLRPRASRQARTRACEQPGQVRCGVGDTQVQWALRRGPTVLVWVGAALAIATLVVSLTWGTGSELTMGEQAARRAYAIGVALLAPLAALTLLSTRRAPRRGAAVIAWVAALAASLVWLTIF